VTRRRLPARRAARAFLAAELYDASAPRLETNGCHSARRACLAATRLAATAPTGAEIVETEIVSKRIVEHVVLLL
jgi:hypothetical protein